MCARYQNKLLLTGTYLQKKWLLINDVELRHFGGSGSSLAKLNNKEC